MPRRQDSAEAILDRIEDRLIDAPEGLHRVGGPAQGEDPGAGELPALPDEALRLWRRWDGLELGNGEARLFALAEQPAATREAAEAGLLREGDRVIGEYGLLTLVVPDDPWAEGGEVVMVEDDGERSPYASSVLRLALGLVAEMNVLLDEEGEYRDGLFEEDGELSARAERRLLRRRLDFDEDAPFPRFRLAQLLRRAGELRGARAELRKVIRCAPEFAWAHWELGRACLALAEAEPTEGEAEDLLEEARRAFADAAEKAGDPHLRALFLAWQARTHADDEHGRKALADEVRELDPGFVAAREAGLREAIEDEDRSRAEELLAIGLAVEPRHLGLLGLREAVAGLPAPEPKPEPEPKPKPKPESKPKARSEARGRRGKGKGGGARRKGGPREPGGRKPKGRGRGN